MSKTTLKNIFNKYKDRKLLDGEEQFLDLHKVDDSIGLKDDFICPEIEYASMVIGGASAKELNAFRTKHMGNVQRQDYSRDRITNEPVKEETDQVDELSTPTLVSYAVKARKNADDRAERRESNITYTKTHDEDKKENRKATLNMNKVDRKKQKNHETGITKAMVKVAKKSPDHAAYALAKHYGIKETEEKIDEVLDTVKAKHSYVKKALYSLTDKRKTHDAEMAMSDRAYDAGNDAKSKEHSVKAAKSGKKYLNRSASVDKVLKKLKENTITEEEKPATSALRAAIEKKKEADRKRRIADAEKNKTPANNSETKKEAPKAPEPKKESSSPKPVLSNAAKAKIAAQNKEAEERKARLGAADSPKKEEPKTPEPKAEPKTKKRTIVGREALRVDDSKPSPKKEEPKTPEPKAEPKTEKKSSDSKSLVKIANKLRPRVVTKRNATNSVSKSEVKKEDPKQTTKVEPKSEPKKETTVKKTSVENLKKAISAQKNNANDNKKQAPVANDNKKQAPVANDNKKQASPDNSSKPRSALGKAAGSINKNTLLNKAKSNQNRINNDMKSGKNPWTGKTPSDHIKELQNTIKKHEKTIAGHEKTIAKHETTIEKHKAINSKPGERKPSLLHRMFKAAFNEEKEINEISVDLKKAYRKKAIPDRNAHSKKSLKYHMLQHADYSATGNENRKKSYFHNMKYINRNNAITKINKDLKKLKEETEINKNTLKFYINRDVIGKK